MVAVSTNLKLVFWDWVGCRYSVTSAVGMVPLSLQYGFDVMETFLQGQPAALYAFSQQCHKAIALYKAIATTALPVLSLMAGMLLTLLIVLQREFLPSYVH